MNTEGSCLNWLLGPVKKLHLPKYAPSSEIRCGKKIVTLISAHYIYNVLCDNFIFLYYEHQSIKNILLRCSKMPFWTKNVYKCAIKSDVSSGWLDPTPKHWLIGIWIRGVARSEGNSRSSSKPDLDRMQVLQRKRTFRVYDIQIVLKTARDKEKKA